MAFAAGADGNGVVVGAGAAGDESFAAVDDVVVTVTNRAGFDVGDVGATAGFGDGKGRDFLAAQYRRYDLLLNFLPGPFWRRAASLCLGSPSWPQIRRSWSA